MDCMSSVLNKTQSYDNYVGDALCKARCVWKSNNWFWFYKFLIGWKSDPSFFLNQNVKQTTFLY